MRNLKKVLVLVLSLAMMLSIMVVGAGAFTDTDKIDDAHQEAVEIATQLNIINGYPDGSFKPEGPITRAEMCKIICVALNGGKEPATAVKAEPSFKDIQGNWAEGFIEYCYAKDIVAGVGNDEFNPNGQVTGAEAAKMLLVALGYNAEAEKYVGPDWDLYVNVQANQDGLYVDLLDIQTKDPLTREHAAQMIWNALQAFTVEKTTSVDRTDGSINDTYAKTETTLFWETYRGYQDTAQMIGFKYDKDAAEWTYYLQINADTMGQQVGKDQIRGNVNGEFTSDKDYTALLGHKVQAIFNIDARNATYKANVGKVYGIFNDSSKEIVTAYFGDIAKMTNKNQANDTVKIGDDTYRLEDGLTFANIPVYEFRAVTDITARQAFQGGDAGNTDLEDVIGSEAAGQITCYDPQKFTAIDKDGNDKIDFLLTTPFSFVKVESLNGTKVQLYGAFVDTLVSGRELVEQPDANGKRWLSDQVSVYDGMAKGDYVKYTAAANTATDVDLLEKPDSVFSGTISKADGRDVTVDSTGYTVAPLEVYTGKGTVSSASAKGNVLTNAQVINGYVFRVEGLKRVSFDDFAIMIQAAGASGIDSAQAKIMFPDGRIEKVDTDRNYNGIIPDGDLVTWYVEDGEYHLTWVNPAVNQDPDLYSMSDKITGVRRISNSNGNIGMIETANNVADINDDAVVFVKYLKNAAAAPSYKVITGAQLKTNPVVNFKPDSTQNVMVLATQDSPRSATNHAEFAYIDLTQYRVIESEDYYGYVTGTDTNAEGYKTLDLWTVDGAKTVTYADDNIPVFNSNGVRDVDPQSKLIEAGMAIRYKTNTAGDVISIKGYYDVDGEVMGTSSYDNDAHTTFFGRTIAITNLPDQNDANQKFEFVQYTGFNPDVVNQDAAGNTLITFVAPDNINYFDIGDAETLYVDIDSDTGYSAGELSTATRHHVTGQYLSNALIVYEGDGTVDLLVYFVGE